MLLGVLLESGQSSAAGRLAVTASVAVSAFLGGRGASARQNAPLLLALALVSLQLAVFAVWVAGTPALAAVHGWQVVVAPAYTGAGLLVLLACKSARWALRLALTLFATSLTLAIVELVLGIVAPVRPGSTGPVWVWSQPPDLDPVLGERNPPYGELRTSYPSDPRGYFERDNGAQFALQLLHDSQATLHVLSDDAETARVDIGRSDPSANWNVQLNLQHVQTQADTEYVLSYRARSDRPRSIWVGFARAQTSGGANLGLYERRDVTPTWQTFTERFVSSGADPDARVHFDLAEAKASVEIGNVRVHRASDGRLVAPMRPVIRYRFNALGCRDRDYTVPRPDGVLRILALGDSFTMGVGVRQPDTFVRQLQTRLTDADRLGGVPGTVEAINCGTSGWSTREERLFYETYGAAYQPNVVLLTMVYNDDMSFLEEQRHGLVAGEPSRAEQLLGLWQRFKAARRSHRAYDYGGTAAELRELDRTVRRHGAALAVVIFQLGSLPQWQALTRAVEDVVRSDDIPLLHLGDALRAHSYADLIVHPIDQHPNERAHAIAARELERFLREHRLLEQR